jgi:hypothetical protein
MSRSSQRGSNQSPGSEERPLTEHERADADVSAMLDGELSPEDEAALRERMAQDPALAERFADADRIDGQLRGLGVLRESEISPERLATMRRGLAARIAADAEASTLEGVAEVVPLRRFRQRALAAAAAIAAGLALYLTAGPSFDPDSSTQPQSQPKPRPKPLSPGGEARTGFDEIAASEADGEELQLARLSDEELVIAIEYETLADYEVIESLDLLEVLFLLDEPEPM